MYEVLYCQKVKTILIYEYNDYKVRPELCIIYQKLSRTY